MRSALFHVSIVFKLTVKPYLPVLQLKAECQAEKLGRIGLLLHLKQEAHCAFCSESSACVQTFPLRYDWNDEQRCGALSAGDNIGTSTHSWR